MASSPPYDGQSSSQYGQGTGQYGQTMGQYGQAPGQYGQAPGQYGQAPGQYGQMPGQYGVLGQPVHQPMPGSPPAAMQLSPGWDIFWMWRKISRAQDNT